MASRKPKANVLEYSIKKTIPLGERLYINDMDCSKDGYLCFSALYMYKPKQSEVLFTSPFQLYVALKANEQETKFQFTYGAPCSTVLQKNGSFTTDTMSWQEDNNTKLVWGEEFGLSNCPRPKPEYTPQGIAVSKYGGYLICLWNNELGERSSGKVISTNKTLQIFTDKNQPLYVCPTYIAENGNGDICVSDFRAVVVTDAGGMLRFRFRGRQKKSNFDPYGICCDSKGNILIADMKNNKIHLISKDGEFLHHVTYDGIRMPRALCIDRLNNLYVGEWDTDTIKKIAQ